jgi:hypothetical protein
MKRTALFLILLLVQSNFFPDYGQNEEPRNYFIQVLTNIADPVLINLSQNKLKESMPIETPPNAYPERNR